VDDEEFKKAVLARLDALEGAVQEHRVHLDRRLDAVVARIEEQDVVQDRLSESMSRLTTAVRDSLAASEQSLNAVTNLGRRVWRLEHPDDK
jgi:hypothetical protein